MGHAPRARDFPSKDDFLRSFSSRVRVMANLLGTLRGQKNIHKGALMKRCHLSWRPRYVELVAEPKDITGHNFDFQLLIFEPRRRQLKNRIKIGDMIAVRSSMDYHFQIFLVSGKMLQFKADTIESQAQWMAMLKVGLGKGSIFHVQVNCGEKLEHALLYSISVNLPAHRRGQLDSVLVLTTPINDINLHAWDFNRIQRFIRLDIGIRVEFCPKCVRNTQEANISFIMEKMFIKDCIKFLCREALINTEPVNENGFLVYNVPHQCFFINPPTENAPPPPYLESALPPGVPEHDYDIAEFVETLPSAPPEPITPALSHDAHDPPQKPMTPAFQFPAGVWGDYSSGSGPPPPASNQPLFPPSYEDSRCLSDSSVFTESQASMGRLPPRTIPRWTPATSMPGTHPYSNEAAPSHTIPEPLSMKTPYLMDGRVVNDEQYERNFLPDANLRPCPQTSSALLFRKFVTLPPRNRVGEGVGVREGVAAEQGGVVTEERGVAANARGHSAVVEPMRELDPVESDLDSLYSINVAWNRQSSPIFRDHPHNSFLNEPHHWRQGERNTASSSSLVTTTFSTHPASPPATSGRHDATHPLSSRRKFAPVPPPLLKRTSSDLNMERHAKGKGRRLSSVISSHHSTNISQSSADEPEDDCYVLVTPPCVAGYKTSASSLSPSYLREDQLLALATRGHTGALSSPLPFASSSTDDKALDDVFVDSDSSQLSLADAGNVIREEWLSSLQQFRQSRERPISEVWLPSENDMGLDEVAFLERRKTSRSSCHSCGDYLDESALVVSPHSRYNGAHWSMGSSSEEEEELSLLVDFDGTDIKILSDGDEETHRRNSRPESLLRNPHKTQTPVAREDSPTETLGGCKHQVKSQHHIISHDAQSPTTTAEPSPPATTAGVSNRHSYHRPRSQYITKKPEIRPRRKASKDSCAAETPCKQLHSNSPYSQCGSTNSQCDRSDHTPPPSAHEHNYSRGYIQSSLSLALRCKPIPAPRKPPVSGGMKSSASASMVTMVMRQWSSSESNLLDAVQNERVAAEVGGACWQEHPTLGHRFHSSTEVNNIIIENSL